MWRLVNQTTKIRPTVVLGLLSGSATTAFCDDGGKGNNSEFWDSLLHKNGKGSIGWDKVRQDMGEGLFWDKLAKKAGQQVQGAIDTGIPTTISYGFVSGFCSGYALKKVGRVVAVVLGLSFLGLQTLANFGYINVDHTQISDDFNKVLDRNNDGKVDQEDAAIVYKQTVDALQLNIPAGGGFAAGFLGGLRSG